MKHSTSTKIRPATIATLGVGLLGGAALAYALSNEERRRSIATAAKTKAQQWQDTSAQITDNVQHALGRITPSHSNDEAQPRFVSQLQSAIPGYNRNGTGNSATDNSHQKMLVVFAATLLSKGLSSILRFRAEQRAHRRVASAAECVARDSANDLESMTVAELRQMASAAELEGRSSMNKEELVQALSDTA